MGKRRGCGRLRAGFQIADDRPANDWIGVFLPFVQRRRPGRDGPISPAGQVGDRLGGELGAAQRMGQRLGLPHRLDLAAEFMIESHRPHRVVHIADAGPRIGKTARLEQVAARAGR